MARLTEYSEDEVAHALAVLQAKGGNALATSRLLGIPRTTVRQWAGRAHSDTASPKQVTDEQVKSSTAKLADLLEQVAFTAVDEGMEAAILKSSAKDRMIVAGIAIEKRQLLIGAPTSRNANLTIHLVAGGSLRELADRTLSGTPALEDGTGSDNT